MPDATLTKTAVDNAVQAMDRLAALLPSAKPKAACGPDECNLLLCAHLDAIASLVECCRCCCCD